MCGRYYFDIDDKDLKEIVQEVEKNLHSEYKKGEIFPTNIAPIITNAGASLAKWGFPKWDNKGVVINARSEGLENTRMFKSLVNTKRCIIPASGFFEWKSHSGAKKKDKYYFKRSNSALYMAGLFNTFHSKMEQLNMFDIETEENQASYVIITKSANEYMAGIHDRMPLIFDKEEMRAWLNGENFDFLLQTNNAVLENSVV